MSLSFIKRAFNFFFCKREERKFFFINVLFAIQWYFSLHYAFLLINVPIFSIFQCFNTTRKELFSLLLLFFFYVFKHILYFFKLFPLHCLTMRRQWHSIGTNSFSYFCVIFSHFFFFFCCCCSIIRIQFQFFTYSFTSSLWWSFEPKEKWTVNQFCFVFVSRMIYWLIGFAEILRQLWRLLQYL